ncbi:LLM class flavin-dependent oxidoreductase [Nocardia blacklockiae]|uniref:LLM class flavin-dependent oxidoreductase n=1 Tax=Nocardia blacklockiae TaxID=480036 RepID=UPI0018943722|nr:LLM class flavin-dependent oxidoreductase [Nocardia blacklockiae]MBF6169846.1 LLM class flavin-dependent oxidoreductase [Nocardia blacklockiae]
MRFGVYVPSYGPYGDPVVVRDLAVAAEQAGWDGFFLYDLIGPLDDAPPPVVDPWVVLSVIAQATTTITLGPMVVPAPRRRPWKLALEAATLQRLSGGRLILGLGAGVATDYTNFGESAARLGSRLDEAAVLLRRILAGGEVEHAGEHYRVSGARFAPIEVPVWTSGFWPRRTPVRAARNAEGLFPQIRDPEHDFRLPTPEELVGIRKDFVAAGGRPDGDIAIWSPSAEPSATRASDYAAAGATWWFSDGSTVIPEQLRTRIEAGPPALT